MAAGNPSIQETFKTKSVDAHGSVWTDLWSASHTPWDRAAPQPALPEVLSSRPDLFPARPDGKRAVALVPGCGRGYDALTLASFGYDVVGLDLAQDAMREARAYEEKATKEGLYPLKEGVKERGEITWVAADFFGDGIREQTGIETFDLIFDYTFLCALPMALRPRWAARTASLLSPTGRLIALQFPMGKPLSQPGPPWGVNSDMYLALLSRPGEEVPCDGDGNVSGAADIKRAEGGLRRLELIVPTKAHDMGFAEDGSVMDRVSVWAH